jgi:hypothetical protein
MWTLRLELRFTKGKVKGQGQIYEKKRLKFVLAEKVN